MKKPENNDYFPLSEYETRLARLRGQMKTDGLDALLLTTEPNVVYTTGFLNGYWVCKNHDDVQIVLITADVDHDPILLLPCNLEHAARTSCISDIRMWSQFDALKGGGAVATVVDAIRGCGLAKARIGMEIGPHDRPGMSLPFLRSLQDSLPGVEWVDGGGVMGRVRAIKSKLEIEKIRKACQITCRAVQVGMDSIREGMSEKELGQIIALEMAKQSPDVCTIHPWFLMIHSTGRGPSAYDGMPTTYRFRKGDYVYVDTGFNFHGYNADMIRCASIGAPSPETERYYKANRDANMAAIEFMRPGVTCKEVYEFFAEKVREKGFAKQIEQQHEANWKFLGHSWGLSLHEMPYLDGVTEDVLQPGMVFSIEGNIFDKMPMSLTTQVLKNEENIVITKDGHEWLTPLSNDLWIAKT
jgi:Xaa-Pro aminopeptidase